MEPMALGSPTSSPGSSPTSNYLPSFLMGEQQMAMPQRNNTLSPNKSINQSINKSFGSPPAQEHNLSSMGSKAMHNISVCNSGPPIKGLFDCLRKETNSVAAQNEISPLQPAQPTPTSNDHDLSNVSDIISLPPNLYSSPIATPISSMYLYQQPPKKRSNDFWVTVYGFPPSALSTILQHFSTCGTIVEKRSPPQNGNWIHLRFASRVECDKALNFNERILGNNLMIGVTECREKCIMDKENICEVTPPRVRTLMHSSLSNIHSDSSYMSSPNAPRESVGLVDKAFDLFFGW